MATLAGRAEAEAVAAAIPSGGGGASATGIGSASATLANSASGKHPYAIMGGGTSVRVHDRRKRVARPAHLHFDANDRYSTVRNARRGSHKLFYTLDGEGPIKLIMVMGLAGAHTQFEPQLRHFALQRPRDFSVCLLDNRGVGASEAPPGRWRTTDLAADALQLLAHLADEDPAWGSGVHVVGFSLGGMAAVEMALMEPERFSTLTLLATHAGGLMGTLPPVRGVAAFCRTFQGLGSAQGLDAALELLFPAAHLDSPCGHLPEYEDVRFAPEVPLTTNRLRYAHALMRRARKYVESRTPVLSVSSVLKQTLAVATHYVSWERLETLRSYRLDVLVVSGEQDKLVGHWNSRILSETLCAKWLHFADAGHGVAEQYADEVNAAIEELVRNAHEQNPPSGRGPRLRQRQRQRQRKPHGPGAHPFQLAVGAMALAALLLRKRLLGRWLPQRAGLLIAFVAVLAHLRRRFGGFFAK